MRTVAARLLIMEKPSAILTKAIEHMGISSLTGKYLKNILQQLSDYLLSDIQSNFNDLSISATVQYTYRFQYVKIVSKRGFV